MALANYNFSPIGRVHSPLIQRSGAPRQPWEGAPEAMLEIYPELVERLEGFRPDGHLGVDIAASIASFDAPSVSSRRDSAHRSIRDSFPRRPNPICLHRTRVLDVDGGRFI